MSDSFRQGGQTPARSTALSPTFIVVGALCLAAAAGAAAFLTFVDKGGREIASAQASVISAADIAADRGAQANARNALVAARTLWVDAGSYEGLAPTALGGVEPDLTFVSGPATGGSSVSFAVGESRVGFAVLSTSGTCFLLSDDGSAPTYGTGAPCTGEHALTASAPSW